MSNASSGANGSLIAEPVMNHRSAHRSRSCGLLNA